MRDVTLFHEVSFASNTAVILQRRISTGRKALQNFYNRARKAVRVGFQWLFVFDLEDEMQSRLFEEASI